MLRLIGLRSVPGTVRRCATSWRKLAAVCCLMAALPPCAACAFSSPWTAPAAVSITDIDASTLTVAVENASGLCLVAAYDTAGKLVASATRHIVGGDAPAPLSLALPPPPAIYQLRVFLLDENMRVQCRAAASAAMYSETASTSRVTGVFIAPELSSAATEAQWLSALGNMQAVGVDTLIVQYCFQSDPRTGSQAYFPYARPDTVAEADWYPLRRSQIGYILSGARRLGMKVHLGLQLAEYEWFDQNKYQDAGWLDAQAAFALELADALWAEFGEEYGDVIAGWYLPLEFESSAEYHPYFQLLTERYYAPLTAALKGSAEYGGKSIMISPLKYAMDDRTAWKENLSLLLSGAQIDILAPQDGIGFGTQSHDSASLWFQASREAVDAVNSAQTKAIRLWGNCENYARLRNPAETDTLEKIMPMSIAKFISSLDIAAPYTEKLVTFSIHRWDTALVDNSAVDVNRPYYEAYRRFADTGRKPEYPSDGYYVRIGAAGGVRIHPVANAGLTDGFASDPDDWRAYLGVSTENGAPFTMELRFDDPVTIKSVGSHYLEEPTAAVALPTRVQYEYLVRSGEHDEVFTYTVFDTDDFENADGITLSLAQLDEPVAADGIRVKVFPDGEWTFIDELMVE